MRESSLEEVEQLFLKRQEAYSLHNSRVLTNELDLETATDQIVESIKFIWDIYQPYDKL